MDELEVEIVRVAIGGLVLEPLVGTEDLVKICRKVPLLASMSVVWSEILQTNVTAVCRL